jgi:pimeloyl-ACP methyl ester carboxylesterase
VSDGTDQLTVHRLGSGPDVVLVHGGVGPELTWERQRPLAERWTLLIPVRRGFPGTAPAERQDFEQDAHDLSPLIGDGAHLVGFSYGGVGAAIVAAEEPRRVKSLTLIEVPLYLVAPDDPAVQEIARSGDAFLAGEADERTEREFLANAGIDPDAAEAESAAQIREAIAAARDGRSPSEAKPDLDAIVRAEVPVLVVSGDHHHGIEVLCDALAERLNAQRKILPGAGHAVPRAAGFNETLEQFLTHAEG